MLRGNACLLLLLLAASLSDATAADLSNPAPIASLVSVPPAAQRRAHETDREVRGLRQESLRLEERAESAAAAALRSRPVSRDVHTHWRIARDYVGAGESARAQERERRLDLYRKAREWARRGRELDPGCTECCFYEYAALGRTASTVGVFSSMGRLREVAAVLEQCLEMPPTRTHADSERERGNLYLGASTFLRILPEGRWVQLLVGARGDSERAVEYGRLAVAISPTRVDYQVELGAGLLCLGRRRGDSVATREGLAVLEHARILPELRVTDSLDRRHAEMLMTRPGDACGYSRDGWVEGD